MLLSYLVNAGLLLLTNRSSVVQLFDHVSFMLYDTGKYELINLADIVIDCRKSIDAYNYLIELLR